MFNWLKLGLVLVGVCSVGRTQTVFISGNSATGFVYDSMAPLGENNLASSDVSTEEVCRVTLVGTNTVQVSNFLGMTQFPDFSAQWWAEFDNRGGIGGGTNGVAQLQSRVNTDPQFERVRDNSTTGLDAIKSAHLSDLGTFNAVGSLYPIQPPGYNAGGFILQIGDFGEMHLDPLDWPDVVNAFSFLRACCLAVASLGVAIFIARDWRDTVSRLQTSQQANGFGDTVLGNNAPNLFAQVNAGLMTVAISSAVVVVSAAAMTLLGLWIQHCFDAINFDGVAGIVWTIFVEVIPVSGLFTLLGVWLGWLGLGMATEYTLRLVVRHTTT